jgi:hypothetical protein
MLDFFASGHPLVEGVFTYFEDSALGRVAYLEIDVEQGTGHGLVAIYKDGPSFDVVAVDAAGRHRPEWAQAFRERPLRARPASLDGIDRHRWAEEVRRLGTLLDRSRRPHAVAAVVTRNRGERGVSGLYL